MKTVEKKKRNCVKGKSCGASCINKAKQCRVDAQNQLSNELKNVAQTIQANPNQERISSAKASIEESKNRIKKWESDSSYIANLGTVGALKGLDVLIKKYQAQYDAMPNWNSWQAKNLKKRLDAHVRDRDKLEFRLKSESLAQYNIRMEQRKLEMAERLLKQLEQG